MKPATKILELINRKSADYGSRHQQKKESFVFFSKDKALFAQKIHSRSLEKVHKITELYQSITSKELAKNLNLKEYNAKINQLKIKFSSIEQCCNDLKKEGNDIEAGYYSDHSELFEATKGVLELSRSHLQQLYRTFSSLAAELMLESTRILMELNTLGEETPTKAKKESRRNFRKHRF